MPGSPLWHPGSGEYVERADIFVVGKCDLRGTRNTVLQFFITIGGHKP
jgi:hypothetical protein